MNPKNRTAVFLAVFALVLAACGGDSGEAESTTTEAPPTTEALATTEAPETPATTLADTTTTTEAASEASEIVPGEDPDVDEIVALYEVVFDSAAPYEEKAPLIEEPDGLEDTVERYADTGSTMGGVTVMVQSVAVSGDEADVLYTLMFSGNPAYADQEGTAIRTDAGWQVSRDMFCGLMASARSACPPA